MALQRYLTLHQAANILNTSLATLNRMIQSGTIQAVEVAGEVIVSEQSILATRKKEDLPEYKMFPKPKVKKKKHPPLGGCFFLKYFLVFSVYFLDLRC